MDTPEEAKQKIRDMVDADKAKAERERPRTYTERLQDMGRLPKPSGGGGGGMGGNKLSSRDLTKAYQKGGTVKSASARADGCCIKGKTRA